MVALHLGVNFQIIAIDAIVAVAEQMANDVVIEMEMKGYNFLDVPTMPRWLHGGLGYFRM